MIDDFQKEEKETWIEISWGNVEPHIYVELCRVMENLKQAK